MSVCKVTKLFLFSPIFTQKNQKKTQLKVILTQKNPLRVIFTKKNKKQLKVISFVEMLTALASVINLAAVSMERFIRMHGK